jgi:ELWxxDGT repeat protein
VNREPRDLTEVNGTLYFRGGAGTDELWKSDGTAAGTLRVVSSARTNRVQRLVEAGGRLLVIAQSNSKPLSIHQALWTSDGTDAGTVLLRDPLGSGAAGAGPDEFVAAGGRVFFLADDGDRGRKLWVTDGTPAGTRPFRDWRPVPPPDAPFPRYLAALNDRLLFAPDDGDPSAEELWTTDGTDAGTAPLTKIYTATEPSSPGTGVSIGRLHYFAASDGILGRELWATDGTAGGTRLVADVNPGAGSSSPASLVELNGTLYFLADDGSRGKELWRSDGTREGTVLVKDVNAVEVSGPHLTVAGGALWFNADDGVHGTEMWKSDGTAAGTVLVKDIFPGSSHARPAVPVAFGGKVLFAATDATRGTEVWASDGTADGTVILRDISPGARGSTPVGFRRVRDTMYFLAAGGNGSELWRTDGTEAGTVQVKDIAPGTASGVRGGLAVMGDVLYFPASPSGVFFFPPGGDVELWRSDGTETGTYRVKDINPGPGGSFPTGLVAVNGVLLFAAEDAAGRKTLWKSNGTEAGTLPVHGVWPGLRDERLVFLNLSVGGTLYFTGDDGSGGEELWQSDGTQAGTRLVADIFPGPFGSRPVGFAVLTTPFSSVPMIRSTESNCGTLPYRQHPPPFWPRHSTPPRRPSP